MEHIVIIGNGISGVTAARHIRKLSDKKITLVSAETDYFFSRTALMYVFMGHMKFEHTQPYENWFWEKNKIELKKGFVHTIETKHNILYFDNGETLKYDKLIIATGSKPNKFGWPGQDLKGVLGMYHKQDLESLETYAPNNKVCQRAVIVGGGLIGIELAEMLHSRHIPVTFLVREASFWNGVLPQEESAIINREILSNGIDLRLSTNLKEIISDEIGQVKSVIIEETGEEIHCNMLGLTAGVSPNINFIRDSEIETGKGVKVNRFLETNISNIYAIGDCAEQHVAIGSRRPIEAVWYTGRMMGETVAQTICGNRLEYKPGHWFNSAKFMDIEYQTYGWVWAQPKEHEKRFYWEHKSGKKCIHISYDKNTHEFIGINTFGIRMRHDFFDRMLSKKQTIEYVLAHLCDANFDPEFYKLHEQEIVGKFNYENSTSIHLKKRSWKRIFKTN
ncbi:MAG: FAD-dependent oxidoreductase [Flavobacteriaceae bacterium]|jgi:NAD(P)H-nitrite reductase large subunit|nr:FAD-dependent oxidoreductase [Bacteroidota bacterium]MDB2612825.1 FAD-dependent oxidoreductase [Flavobacteriaceae bacterium]MDC0956539.1 FAD-dependent oxidoreductase [Flavobacteriaceae bacterium]MDC3242823.1 FAD-dependent oxidoreductase [Flavobacteriaceae bacterium]MDG1378679.1 FAD-dependent oxidoreductase [Flavobacteriaceae bacterium]|tara:strand:+ start:13588 stop:14931 length:1344 start_codon:yes stop_codon:yes gene_type:complete